MTSSLRAANRGEAHVLTSATKKFHSVRTASWDTVTNRWQSVKQKRKHQALLLITDHQYRLHFCFRAKIKGRFKLPYSKRSDKCSRLLDVKYKKVPNLHLKEHKYSVVPQSFFFFSFLKKVSYPDLPQFTDYVT